MSMDQAFYGEYAAVLEADGSLVLPEAFDQRFRSRRCVAVMNDVLQLYPEQALEEVLESPSEKVTLEPDRRIRLSEKLLERAGLVPGDRLTLLGMFHCMEIWPADRWAEESADKN